MPPVRREGKASERLAKTGPYMPIATEKAPEPPFNLNKAFSKLPAYSKLPGADVQQREADAYAASERKAAADAARAQRRLDREGRAAAAAEPELDDLSKMLGEMGKEDKMGKGRKSRKGKGKKQGGKKTRKHRKTRRH